MQSDATRKRKWRVQTAKLFADLGRLSDLHRGAASAGPLTSEDGSPGAAKEDFVYGGRVEVLRKVASIVKHYTSQSPEQRAGDTDASVMWYHRPGMLLSSTLGTMLIRTNDLVVMDTSKALANMWMLAEKNERSQGWQTTLVGQSLWTLVHWDDHDALSEMQAMFERRDCSVVGRRVDLLLIRMTNSEEGGLAKVVRRRLEVLHLSDDGKTALLGLNVRDEDRRALVIGEEGREFCKHWHVFKLKTVDAQGQSSRDGAKEAASDSQGAAVEDSVRSLKHIQAFSNWTRTMDAWGSFSPDMFPVICKDSANDGALRHMVFARVPFAGSLSGQSQFIPLFNVRSGYFTSPPPISGPGNASQFAATSSGAAWMGWMIPGDDSHSREYPWEFKRALGKPEEKQSATHGCRFLISFFVGPRTRDQLGECAGYLHASQTGPTLLARMTGEITERRPWMRSEPKTVCLGDWGGKLQDSQELIREFISWGSQSPFYDTKDAFT
jgi:hypothetical protein